MFGDHTEITMSLHQPCSILRYLEHFAHSYNSKALATKLRHGCVFCQCSATRYCNKVSPFKLVRYNYWLVATVSSCTFKVSELILFTYNNYQYIQDNTFFQVWSLQYRETTPGFWKRNVHHKRVRRRGSHSITHCFSARTYACSAAAT